VYLVNCHRNSHLPGERSDDFLRQWRGGLEAHGFRDTGGIVERLEDPVNAPAMVVDVLVQEGAEAVDEAHGP